nr:hypothetical protein [Tanacetum cinerariifolium]
MANSNNPYASPAPHQDLSPFNQNYMQQPMPIPEDITDPTTNVRNQVAQNPRVQNDGIQNQIGNGNLVAVRACTVRPRRRDAAYLQTQLLIAQKEEAGIQLQAEEYDLMAAAADLDEIEEVNANCILMANLQQASSSSTQTDNTPVYDSDGSAEVHEYENCYNNEIFNMFTQEEQYTELLEPIPEPQQVPQNDNNVISEAKSREEVYFSNTSKMASVSNTVSKPFSIHVDESSDDTLSVARKFLNEEKTSLIIKDEIALIINQVDARVQNFKNHFVKEAAKYVRDFKSIAKEDDESLDKIMVLENKRERLLRVVVIQYIIYIVQRPTVVETSDLQTELERTNE